MYFRVFSANWEPKLRSSTFFMFTTVLVLFVHTWHLLVQHQYYVMWQKWQNMIERPCSLKSLERGKFRKAKNLKILSRHCACKIPLDMPKLASYSVVSSTYGVTLHHRITCATWACHWPLVTLLFLFFSSNWTRENPATCPILAMNQTIRKVRGLRKRNVGYNGYQSPYHQHTTCSIMRL